MVIFGGVRKAEKEWNVKNQPKNPLQWTKLTEFPVYAEGRKKSKKWSDLGKSRQMYTETKVRKHKMWRIWQEHVKMLATEKRTKSGRWCRGRSAPGKHGGRYSRAHLSSWHGGGGARSASEHQANEGTGLKKEGGQLWRMTPSVDFWPHMDMNIWITYTLHTCHHQHTCRCIHTHTKKKEKGSMQKTLKRMEWKTVTLRMSLSGSLPPDYFSGVLHLLPCAFIFAYWWPWCRQSIPLLFIMSLTMILFSCL